ncbi:M1 family metallopeptidase [Lacinutrix sp.]|uniref:M1 family metallopeptidase n=1 Tax=Lacinutrix sp. TaxID=1937692 RepID=UPI0026143777|nr:M1 family metallopeptidase [Lacinutrix sp.]MDG1715225.1 M1 family metallopeptidase [Lacinutrix sp.]
MKHILFIFLLFICFTIQAQQTEYVDFKTVKASLYIDLIKAEVTGSVEYSFDILKATDSIFLDSPNIIYDSIEINGLNNFNLNSEAIVLNGIVKRNFVQSKDNVMVVKYHVKPKKALYFINKDEGIQAWTQGQGKYTSNWLPSLDDTNDKMEFDLSIKADSDYQVISNGQLLNIEKSEGYNTWHYDMQKPMSSYLVALTIGKYNKQELTSKSGIPIELYYYPEDSARVEPTYRYTKKMFDFLEEEIGVPYPWQNYKQVPVKDFLYSGMENTSLTIFSDDFMIDETSFVDKNYVNVNAHELAHQWFGDFVTATEGKHHWLQEGFATYYALLAEHEVFGDDYYYNRLYEYAKELIVQEQEDQATALLDAKASSTTFYKKGAWALHMLKEIVGEQVFKQAVKNYLNAYAYKNVETQDFITEVEKLYGQNLNSFENEWLLSKTLPLAKMRATLKQNESIAFLETIEHSAYLSYRTDNNGYVPSSLVTELPKGFYTERLAVLREALKKPDYPTYKDLIDEAFNSNEIKTRQLLAQRIPEGFKAQNESLLKDASYLTVEYALMNLWSKFPKDRAKYLETTKEIIGFNDKNVRCLWLTLALITPEYNPAFNDVYLRELKDYTSSQYGFKTRQNAFSYINNIQIFDFETLANLIDATNHHNWRFKSFASDLLQSLSEDQKYKSIISDLQEQLKNK